MRLIYYVSDGGAAHTHTLCYYKKTCKANIQKAHPRMLFMSERGVRGKLFSVPVGC